MKAFHIFTGKLDFGYKKINNKIKNTHVNEVSKSIKISVIIDQNGAPHYINIIMSMHNLKIMETHINDNLKNNKKPI